MNGYRNSAFCHRLLFIFIIFLMFWCKTWIKISDAKTGRWWYADDDRPRITMKYSLRWIMTMRSRTLKKKRRKKWCNLNHSLAIQLITVVICMFSHRETALTAFDVWDGWNVSRIPPRLRRIDLRAMRWSDADSIEFNDRLKLSISFIN